VFIANKPNKWGNRFGFVWFFDVKNETRMEYELDAIRIGSMKLHVNLPRYSRRSIKSKAGKMRREVAMSSARQPLLKAEIHSKILHKQQKMCRVKRNDATKLQETSKLKLQSDSAEWK